MQNLNDKSWYRLLKVIFVIAFLLIQIISIGGTAFILSAESVISPQTVEKVGQLVKDIYPQYQDMQNENFGRKIYEKSYGLWSDFTYYISYSGYNTQISKDGKVFDKIKIEYQGKFNRLQIIGFCLIPLTMVSIIFWLVSRIFFYVVAKDKFLSGRLVNMLKKPFTKKFNVKR